MKKIALSFIALATILSAGNPVTQKEQVITSQAPKASLADVDETKLEELMKKGTIVIDVRTPQEWKQTGIIDGAHKIMFFDVQGQAHAQEWMGEIEKLGIKKDTPFVIYCAHANRTKAIGNWLVNQLGYTNVMELKGGIEYGWIDKGKKTTKK